MDVAIVDYTDPDAPKQFTDSLRDTGFAVLVNHPLPWSLVEQIYLEWATLFDSPAVEQYQMDTAGQTGWFSRSTSETAKGHTVRDFKEFFQIYDSSTYPHEVSGAATTYRKLATDVAIQLLDWVQAHTPSVVREKFSMPLPKMVSGSTGALLRVRRLLPSDHPSRGKPQWDSCTTFTHGASAVFASR
jgi:non-haem dioxygenase in morphine synthesis N-terminal